MLYLPTILFIFSILVPVSLFPLNTTFIITMEVLNKYRSRCVYMFHSTQTMGKWQSLIVLWNIFVIKRTLKIATMNRESMTFLELIWELTPYIRHTYGLHINAVWQLMPCGRRRGNCTGEVRACLNRLTSNNLCQTVFVTTFSENEWHIEIVTVEF